MTRFKVIQGKTKCKLKWFERGVEMVALLPKDIGELIELGKRASIPPYSYQPKIDWYKEDDD